MSFSEYSPKLYSGSLAEGFTIGVSFILITGVVGYDVTLAFEPGLVDDTGATVGLGSDGSSILFLELEASGFDFSCFFNSGGGVTTFSMTLLTGVTPDLNLLVEMAAAASTGGSVNGRQMSSSISTWTLLFRMDDRVVCGLGPFLRDATLAALGGMS